MGLPGQAVCLGFWVQGRALVAGTGLCIEIIPRLCFKLRNSEAVGN